MKINIQQTGMLSSSQELLRLSRGIQQAGDEISDVERRLCNLSDLDSCRVALRQQRTSLELLTGQVVHMASALHEITAAYIRTEQQNDFYLDDIPILQGDTLQGQFFRGEVISQKIQKILKK